MMWNGVKKKGCKGYIFSAFCCWTDLFLKTLPTWLVPWCHSFPAAVFYHAPFLTRSWFSLHLWQNFLKSHQCYLVCRQLTNPFSYRFASVLNLKPVHWTLLHGWPRRFSSMTYPKLKFSSLSPVKFYHHHPTCHHTVQVGIRLMISPLTQTRKPRLHSAKAVPRVLFILSKLANLYTCLLACCSIIIIVVLSVHAFCSL